jgi:hypothetical protein
MLFQATLLVDLYATAITLWLAFYLLSRGYLSKITLRAVVLLLALSMFFLGAYNNLFEQVVGTAALRAIMLILGLGAWHSLTFHLTARSNQRGRDWLGVAIYTLSKKVTLCGPDDVYRQNVTFYANGSTTSVCCTPWLADSTPLR